jgi:hypothetical protein
MKLRVKLKWVKWAMFWMTQASKLTPGGALLAETRTTGAKDQQGEDPACVVHPPREDPPQTLDADEIEGICRFRDTLPW